MQHFTPRQLRRLAKRVKPPQALLPFKVLRNSGPPISAPVEVGIGSPGTGTGTSVAPTYPGGIAADDILFLWVTARDLAGNGSIATPAGWNVAIDFYHGTSDVWLALFWKRAVGGESGSVTVSFSESLSSGMGFAIISSWRGCVLTGTPYERLGFNYHGAALDQIGKSLRTAGPTRKALSFCGSAGVNSAVSGTNTNGWTEHYAGSTSTGAGAAVSIHSFDQAVAGKVDGLRRTLSVSLTHLCVTLALLPVSGVAGAADPFDDVILQVQPNDTDGSTTFVDESYYSVAPITANGNAQILSNKVELDGTGDFVHFSTDYRPLWRMLTVAATASDNFTIDLFDVQVDSLVGSRTLCAYWYGSGGTNHRSWYFQVLSTGAIQFGWSTGGSGTNGSVTSAAGVITAGSVNTIRYVRSLTNAEVYLYVNGTKVATAALLAATNFFNATTGTTSLDIGCTNGNSSPQSYMDGRIGAFRMTRGALSTGASYTPETLPIAA